jgi:hypothetical protein
VHAASKPADSPAMRISADRTLLRNTDPAPSSLSVAGRAMRREVRDWAQAPAEHRPAAACSLARAASQRYLR